MALDNYRKILRHRGFRWLVLGLGLSNLGDALSIIAVPWLAVEMSTAEQRPLAVTAAVLAYSLPGAVVGLAAPRLPARLTSRQLLLANSSLRAAALAAIPILHWAGYLSVGVLIPVLAISSLLNTWGAAGGLSLIPRLLKSDELMAGNALLFGQGQVALIVGPLAAGALIATIGSPATIGIDALTFAAMFFCATRLRGDVDIPDDPEYQIPRNPLRLLLGHPKLGAILGVSLVFFLLYGPVEPAVPLHVRDSLGGATVFGALGTAFGAGALVGTFAVGAVSKIRLWPAALAIIAGWGIAVLALGLSSTVWVALVVYGLGAMVYAPYPVILATALQTETDPRRLTSVGAAWTAVVIMTTPLGIIFGLPVIATFGGRETLLVSGGATILLAAVGSIVALSRTRRSRGQAALPDEPPGQSSASLHIR